MTDSDLGLPIPELRALLSDLLSDTIDALVVEPLTSIDSASGVPLYRVRARSNEGDHHLVIKVASSNGDWIARATDDQQVREAALARQGLPNLLPPGIEWPVLAVIPTATGDWLITMRDLAREPGVQLVPQNDVPLDPDETAYHLDSLAGLHTSIAGHAATLAAVSFCSVGAWLTLLGPATIQRERNGIDRVTPHLASGWETFLRIAPSAVSERVTELLVDPAPLVDALDSRWTTLLHGDYKFGNLGRRDQDGRMVATIALDWSQAMWGPPELDLAWFLAVNSARLPFAKEHAIDIYRDALGVTDSTDWQRQLDLALLGGGVLRLGWAKALGTKSDNPQRVEAERAEFAWWMTVAERAIRELS